MIRGYTLEEVVAGGHAPSVRWLREAIKRGEVPGYRIPRKGRGGGPDYRMTTADIEAFIESRRIVPAVATSTGLNLTARSARARARAAVVASVESVPKRAGIAR